MAKNVELCVGSEAPIARIVQEPVAEAGEDGADTAYRSFNAIAPLFVKTAYRERRVAAVDEALPQGYKPAWLRVVEGQGSNCIR